MFSSDCALAQQAFVDPIVSPGTTSEHLHDFFGASNVTPISTTDGLRAGGSTCTNGDDTAAYWAPALIAPDGTVVKPTNVLAYYRAAPGSPVRAFPDGLKIVADADAMSLKSGYSCSQSGPFSPIPVDCGAGGYLKLHIAFPSCWDGANLDSPDHRSHMSYDCNAAYPIRLPKLAIHVQYRGLQDAATGGYMPSNHMGATPGIHADYFSTWQPGTLEDIVAKCLNAGTDCTKMV